MAKELVKNDVINTTDSIFKQSNKSEAELKKIAFGTALEISKGKRVKFQCKKALAPLYPDGLMTTYQGISVTIFFNGDTIELPEAVAAYVNKKIDLKAEKVADRLDKFNSKKQSKIGEFNAG